MENQSTHESSYPKPGSANTRNIIVTLTIDTEIYRGIQKIKNWTTFGANDDKTVSLCKGRVWECLCGNNSRKTNAHLEAMSYSPFMPDP